MRETIDRFVGLPVLVLGTGLGLVAVDYIAPNFVENTQQVWETTVDFWIGNNQHTNMPDPTYQSVEGKVMFKSMPYKTIRTVNGTDILGDPNFYVDYMIDTQNGPVYVAAVNAEPFGEGDVVKVQLGEALELPNRLNPTPDGSLIRRVTNFEKRDKLQ